MPLQSHSALVTATDNHAQYYVDNVNDPSAMVFGPHGEVAGKPDFTGQWPWDRDLAAGYPANSGFAEVMHFIGDPNAAVDGWMFTIYHRVLLLGPDYYYAGYGIRNGAQPVDVFDLATGPLPTGISSPPLSGFLVYPANNQTGVPTFWSGGESPSPLPPGADTPVGYPVTIQGATAGLLVVSVADLRDGEGDVVPVYPNPANCSSFGCYALIPVSPLDPNTTYSVHVVGSVGSVPVNQTTHFTTGGVSGEVVTQGIVPSIGPPAFRP